MHKIQSKSASIVGADGAQIISAIQTASLDQNRLMQNARSTTPWKKTAAIMEYGKILKIQFNNV